MNSRARSTGTTNVPCFIGSDLKRPMATAIFDKATSNQFVLTSAWVAEFGSVNFRLQSCRKLSSFWLRNTNPSKNCSSAGKGIISGNCGRSKGETDTWCVQVAIFDFWEYGVMWGITCMFANNKMWFFSSWCYWYDWTWTTECNMQKDHIYGSVAGSTNMCVILRNYS